MDSSFQNLVAHIEAGIAQRESRTLFADMLVSHWPKGPEERAKAIRVFAAAHGWAVAIHRQGQRATFTKL